MLQIRDYFWEIILTGNSKKEMIKQLNQITLSMGIRITNEQQMNDYWFLFYKTL